MFRTAAYQTAAERFKHEPVKCMRALLANRAAFGGLAPDSRLRAACLAAKVMFPGEMHWGEEFVYQAVKQLAGAEPERQVELTAEAISLMHPVGHRNSRARLLYIMYYGRAFQVKDDGQKYQFYVGVLTKLYPADAFEWLEMTTAFVKAGKMEVFEVRQRFLHYVVNALHHNDQATQAAFIETVERDLPPVYRPGSWLNRPGI